MNIISKLFTILSILSIVNSFELVPDNNGSPTKFERISSSDIDPLNFNTYTDIHMNLFTRSNTKQAKRIQLNSEAQLRASYFNPSHPTRVLIHGLYDSGNSREIVMLRDAYLSAGDFNVFVVDYERGAAAGIDIAIHRVGPVGQHVAMFLDFLKITLGYAFSFDSVTVIGHSMGADVAGFVGKSVRKGRIAKLVALDPRSKGIMPDQPAKRDVERSDADYVESIHSDIGSMGLNLPIGHAAFYPSFGRNQPACQTNPPPSCNHMIAVEYFAESVKNPLAFYGTRCASFDSILKQSCPSTGEGKFMGGEPLVPLKGENSVYYMAVNAKSPFGQGK